MISGLKNIKKLVSLCYKKLNMSKKNSNANKTFRKLDNFSKIFFKFKTKIFKLKKKSLVIYISGVR